MDEDNSRRRHLRSVPGASQYGGANPPNVTESGSFVPPPATHPGSNQAFQAAMPPQARVQSYLHSLQGYGAPRRGLSGVLESLLPSLAYAAVAGATIAGVASMSRGGLGRALLIGGAGGIALLMAERALYDPGQVRPYGEKLGYGAAAVAAGGAATYLAVTG